MKSGLSGYSRWHTVLPSAYVSVPSDVARAPRAVVKASCPAPIRLQLSNSRLVPLMNDGANLTIVWDVTVTTLSAFAVPKGSANVSAATRFLATVCGPDQVASISQALGTAPVNKAAKPNLSANAKKVEVYGPANTGETVLQDVDWYASNFDAVTTKLNTWLVG